VEDKLEKAPPKIQIARSWWKAGRKDSTRITDDGILVVCNRSGKGIGIIDRCCACRRSLFF
jgi:hypothetical protein